MGGRGEGEKEERGLQRAGKIGERRERKNGVGKRAVERRQQSIETDKLTEREKAKKTERDKE